MGIFFDDTKPHVSLDEFKKVREALSSYDFKHIEIETLRKDKDIYYLTDPKLDILSEKMKKYL